MANSVRKLKKGLKLHKCRCKFNKHTLWTMRTCCVRLSWTGGSGCCFVPTCSRRRRRWRLKGVASFASPLEQEELACCLLWLKHQRTRILRPQPRSEIFSPSGFSLPTEPPRTIFPSRKDLGFPCADPAPAGLVPQSYVAQP